MSLREKTISGAKWSAIATVIIIGLGLVQMTVLARIIDNHQFGLLTVSLVIIALADTLSDFGIANSIIQRKEISHLELTTLYWLNVGLGLVVCVAVFLLSDVIGDVLNNPDLAPLIKTLSLAFVVIPHGQQFRALMQKELEFNKIGMIETSAVLAGFTFTVVSAHFWPLAMTAILGYLVNSAVRTLLFGYFGRKIYCPGLHFSLASVAPNLRFGAWLTAKARVDISFKFNVFKTFLFIPAIVIGGQMAGAIGVTLGFLLVQIINTILSYFVMIKPVLGSSYRQYILSLWLPFYLSLPTLVVSYALGIVLKGQLALGMLLAVQIAAGVLAFVVMIVLSRHPLVVEVKRQFCRSEKMKMLLRAG
ncbi:MOP flippase family protein [Shigella flexneri]